jgi:pyruvate/2-oxoacid:ferredoxin oxidoreductase alpha subunit
MTRRFRAFNLAERYQLPVILLSDQSMGYRTKTMDRPRTDNIHLENRVHPDAAALEDYKRFADTDTGVSPTMIPEWRAPRMSRAASNTTSGATPTTLRRTGPA